MDGARWRAAGRCAAVSSSRIGDPAHVWWGRGHPRTGVMGRRPPSDWRVRAPRIAQSGRLWYVASMTGQASASLPEPPNAATNAGPFGPWSVLRQRDFRLLCTGLLVSNTG